MYDKDDDDDGDGDDDDDDDVDEVNTQSTHFADWNYLHVKWIQY